MRARPMIPLGVIVGLLAGVVVALSIPETRAAQDRAATVAVPVVDPGASTVLRVAKAEAAFGDIRLVRRGPVRIEARAADPLGGPEWAVRVFRADRVLAPGSRRHGVSPVIGHNLCAQLGRIHRGSFGWLDAAGTFRPVRIAANGGGTTAFCTTRRPTLNHQPWLLTLSPITEPAAPVARVKSTVAWGLAGSGARAVTLRLAGRAVIPDKTPHRAFLAVAGPELGQRQITGTITYPGGRTVTVPRRSRVSDMGGLGGTTRLAARAPDPNGGLPFAMTAGPGPRGGWCTSTGGRIVGDRIGGVDYRQDVLAETRFDRSSGCSGTARDEAGLFKEHPVLLGYSGGGDAAQEGGDTGNAGRVARRTQRGLMIFNGRVAPDVVAVTLETPRDVRTLIPSGPAHSILVVYDGSFPTGKIRIVAHFKDGHTKVDTLPYIGL